MAALKTVQRLDYDRLAEALGERGLIDPQALKQLMAHCVVEGVALTDALIDENLIGDWELSKVVSEIFGFAFLPVDAYEPSREALEGIDHEFLRQHCLVPLDRYGDLLSVAMPAMVPSDVLARLAQLCKAQVLPIVSSVIANRNWIEVNIPAPQAEVQEVEITIRSGEGGADGLEPDGDWLQLFDEADQQVQKTIKDKGPGR
jgi:hypothetical protein